MKEVYLLLGSNSGDRIKMLSDSVLLIEENVGQILKKSSLYETEPWGKSDQDLFLNQVLLVNTSHGPESLLQANLRIEERLGRVRNEKWGPRLIDIDILYYGDEIIVKELLKIPHPEMHKRRFTLKPLSEIAPDFKHPVLNLSSLELLNRCEDPLEVNMLNIK